MLAVLQLLAILFSRSILNWENKAKSAGAYVGFLIGVWFFEPWMITLGLLFPFLYNMVLLTVTGGWDKSSEEEEEEEEEEGKGAEKNEVCILGEWHGQKIKKTVSYSQDGRKDLRRICKKNPIPVGWDKLGFWHIFSPDPLTYHSSIFFFSHVQVQVHHQLRRKTIHFAIVSRFHLTNWVSMFDLKEIIYASYFLGVSYRHCSAVLTHFILTAKQLFLHFLQIFRFIFQILRPEHDCNVKFTSCST